MRLQTRKFIWTMKKFLKKFFFEIFERWDLRGGREISLDGKISISQGWAVYPKPDPKEILNPTRNPTLFFLKLVRDMRLQTRKFIWTMKKFLKKFFPCNRWDNTNQYVI